LRTGPARVASYPQVEAHWLAAQAAAWITMALEPHCGKHWMGEPPPCTQTMRHSSAMAHVGSSRHVSAWAQQFMAMQSPQGLPSDGQFVGGPQTPPLHSPSQHCAAVVHIAPLAEHWLPQMPPEQVLEQQSENATQVPPLAVQVGGPQRPFEQRSSQHSLATMHGVPTAPHIVVPQTPFVQAPEQQGSIAVQGEPSGWHVVTSPQIPSTPQTAEQHCAGVVQGKPLGSQVTEVQRPLAQLPSQHCAPVMQTDPLGWQDPQKPFVHSPAQQSVGSRHFSPSGSHTPAPQVPLGPQMSEQHYAALVQGKVSGSQGGPAQEPPVQMLVQQSELSTQSDPTSPHVDEHSKSTQKSKPAQQSEADMQGSPGSSHSMQTPLLQSSLQQSELCAQPSPSGWHMVVGMQMPSTEQSSLQQSEFCVQDEPSFTHSQKPLPVQVPAPGQQSEATLHGPPWPWQFSGPQTSSTLQSALQQSPLEPQGEPSGMHSMLPQTPSVQTSEQQSEAVVQLAPSSPQDPQTPPPQTPAQQSEGSVHEAPKGAQDEPSGDVPPVPADSPGSSPRRSLRPQLAERRGPPTRAARTKSSEACR
jgi:hypothetical protein